MKFKPMHDDVLLRNIPEREVYDSPIFFVEDPGQKKLQYFEVLAVGERCTEVAVGDTVICSWTNMTPPFKFDGEQVAVTSEKMIEAVIDK